MSERHMRFWPKGAPRELDWPVTGLYENLAITARRFPDRAAIQYYGTMISYAALLEQVDRLAGYLATACGVARRDRVLLDMQNSPHFLIAYYAVQRLSAVVVPVNPMSKTDELRHYVKDTGARVALCGQEVLPFLQPLLEEGCLSRVIVAHYGSALTAPTDLPLPEVVAAAPLASLPPQCTGWDAAIAQGGEAPPHHSKPDDWALLIYSSGTTGAPKGCLHTQRSITVTSFGVICWQPSSPQAVHLTSLPLFHATGMQSSMNAPIYNGGTLVIMTRWDRRAAALLIQRYRVTHWRNITTMLVDLLSDPDLPKYDLSSLAGIGGGGAAMPAAISERLRSLTGLEYIEGYGLSETIAATHVNPADRPKPQCLGIPFFGVDSRVVNPDSLAELGPNETGEIVISGPQVMVEYWKNPTATAAAFFECDGRRYLRTGDLGYFDEDGYYFLVDRLKRMINAAGFKVWPNEVEAMMYAHPDIREVCVIAARDPHRGETVKAVVVPKAGSPAISPEDLQAWCRERMANYKVPRDIVFAESLPKSATGKILWRVLQEQEQQAART